jgi:hypothetical protein
MSELSYVAEVAQTLYYLALSITGPVALFSYLRAKKQERQEQEYRTYDELDNKYLEYQKLALQHDLDLIDLPDFSPYLEGDRLRRKHELVTAACGFSLFQRAYLMFHRQSDEFKRRQWQGWDRLLTAFLARPSTQDAWQVCKLHFDRDFQAFVDERLADNLARGGADPAVVYAFRKTGLLVSDRNEHATAAHDLAAWRAALADYKNRRAA